MEAVKEKYIKGFNHAYLLKKYRPELIEGILNTTSNNDYIQGLKDGDRTYEHENIKSRLQELKGLKNHKTKNRNLGLER